MGKKHIFFVSLENILKIGFWKVNDFLAFYFRGLCTPKLIVKNLSK